jgi:hypothetical protein
MDKTRQDCNALADDSARKDCLMRYSAGSSPAGESKVGATPATGSSQPSDGSGKSH